jgi:hypothetical protein
MGFNDEVLNISLSNVLLMLLRNPVSLFWQSFESIEEGFMKLPDSAFPTRN